MLKIFASVLSAFAALVAIEVAAAPSAAAAVDPDICVEAFLNTPAVPPADGGHHIYFTTCPATNVAE